MRYLILIPWLCLSCASAGKDAPVTPAPVVSALEAAVDEVLAAPIAEWQFSGVVLVEKDGRPLLRKAYGLADRELGTPNTPETPFMIMSVSKQLTAALVLRLVARGRLSLEDPAGKYLENWPSEWQAVKIHNLLSHSSGIDIDTTYFWLIKHHPVYWPEPGAPPPYEPRALLTPPGTTFLYSNVGYTLLTRIVAVAGGKPFDQLMREEVLEPLGLHHTRPERGERVAGRARGYQPKGDGLELSEQRTIDIVGAGDLVSTVDDLAKWDRALDDDLFLPANLRAAMLTPHVIDPQRGGVGYGWFLREKSAGGRAMRFHTGGGAGFRAFNYRLPDQRLSVIVLSNVWVTKAPWATELLTRVEALTSDSPPAPP